MMDITPTLNDTAQLIDGYGNYGFTIGGVRHEGSVLVFPEQSLAWDVGAFQDVTLKSFRPFLDVAVDIELLLFGTGASMALVPKEIRLALDARNIGVDVMDTGAACRTFNILLAEDRKVAAALVAV